MRVWPVYGPFGIEISKDINLSLKWLKILKTTFSETPRSLWNRFFVEKFDFFHGFYEKLSKIEIYPNLWSSLPTKALDGVDLCPLPETEHDLFTIDFLS